MSVLLFAAAELIHANPVALDGCLARQHGVSFLGRTVALPTTNQVVFAPLNLCDANAGRYSSSDVSIPDGEVCFVAEKSVMAKLS